MNDRLYLHLRLISAAALVMAANKGGGGGTAKAEVAKEPEAPVPEGVADMGAALADIGTDAPVTDAPATDAPPADSMSAQEAYDRGVVAGRQASAAAIGDLQEAAYEKGLADGLAQAKPAAAPEPVSFAPGADLPDGTPHNKVAFAIERLEAAVADLVGEGSNGDVHMLNFTVNELKGAFEAYPVPEAV